MHSEDEAQKHSQKVADYIQQQIANAGGYISFARFMEAALYAPGLGYYSAGTHKFGKGGDFVTAPEISPLFAQCLARQCQQILTECQQGNILELGAGSGTLALQLLLELEKNQCLPEHYFILEVSAELRQRQQIFLKTHCPHLFAHFIWLDTLPEHFDGVILANEVLDALPVHCFHIAENGIQERCVTWENQAFAWQLTPPTSAELQQKVHLLQQEFLLDVGYESEINLALPAFIRSLADCLNQGVILLFDYGYGRREYYHPDRQQGTLMCFYQHKAHDNPLIHIGLQDMTAHVDFTSVAESAITADLYLAGFTTQASFLFATGLMEIAEAQTLTDIERYHQAQAIKTLTLPSQMGELVKAMALSRNITPPLLGFSLYNRKRDL